MLHCLKSSSSLHYRQKKDRQPIDLASELYFSDMYSICPCARFFCPASIHLYFVVFIIEAKHKLEREKLLESQQSLSVYLDEEDKLNIIIAPRGISKCFNFCLNIDEKKKSSILFETLNTKL